MNTFADRLASVKRRLLTLHHGAHAGHVGSTLSCVDLLVYARFAWMRSQDVLVLSKGHAALALYAVLAEAGDLPKDVEATCYKDGTAYPAHPHSTGDFRIPFASGSLGHGLSLAAGMAFGLQLQGQDKRVFCLTSDGELDSGSTWEAAMFIAHHRLTNVIWTIDRNGLQGIGKTEDVLRLEPLRARLESFGYTVIETDGHDPAQLDAARHQAEQCLKAASRPVAIIARTVKGHGIASMENAVAGHYLPLTEAEYAAAMKSLETAPKGSL